MCSQFTNDLSLRCRWWGSDEHSWYLTWNLLLTEMDRTGHSKATSNIRNCIDSTKLIHQFTRIKTNYQPVISNQSVKHLHPHSTHPQKMNWTYRNQSQSTYLVNWIPRCRVGRGQLWIISTLARPHLHNHKESDTSCQPPQVKSNPITEISTYLSNVVRKLLWIIHHGGLKG